jgi:hypothetical protein
MLSEALAYAQEQAKRMHFVHYASDIQADSCCDPTQGPGLLVTPCQFAELYASTGSA